MQLITETEKQINVCDGWITEFKMLSINCERCNRSLDPFKDRIFHDLYQASYCEKCKSVFERKN